MAFLSVKNIVKKFDTQTALNNVNVDIEKGELVSILGPSGCGKTTLLRIIAGLETPDMGQVFIDGKDCTQLPPSKRNFGIVFQSYALFPHMTVEQNLMFGLNQQKHLSKAERKERTKEVLDMVDLYEHRKKYPAQLSGGQQQRIALARAISLKPAFLLLDEPLSALDAKVRVKLRAEIRRIQKKLGITTILVTHDQEEALTMADKIVVMNNAVIEQVGTPKEIYNVPKTAFTANFIGTMNLYQQDKMLLGVESDRKACFRKADIGDETFAAKGHSAPVSSVAFSHTGGKFVSASYDKTLKIWNTSLEEEPLPPLDGHRHYVRCAAWSPDDSTIISGGDDRELFVWDVPTWINRSGEKKKWSLTAHEGWIYSVAWSASGEYFSSGDSQGILCIWKYNYGNEPVLIKKILQAHRGSIQCIAWSAARKEMFVSGSADGQLKLWIYQEEKSCKEFDDGIDALAFSPDGQMLVVGAGKEISVWKIVKQDSDFYLQRIDEWKISGDAISGIVWTRDFIAYGMGREIRILSSEHNWKITDNEQYLWNPSESYETASVTGHKSLIKCIAWSEQEKTLLTGSDDSSIRIWKARNPMWNKDWNCIRVIEGASLPVRCVAWSEDSKNVVAGYDDNVLRLWNIEEEICYQVLRGHENRIKCVDWKGPYLASGSNDKSLRIWKNAGYGMAGEADRQKNTSLCVKNCGGAVNCVKWFSNQHRVISGSDDGILLIWNWETGEEQYLRGHENRVYGADLSPDEDIAASGSNDRTIRFWNTHTGKEIEDMRIVPEKDRGHQEPIRAVAWSQTREIPCLFSASNDKTLICWEEENGIWKEQRQMTGHEDFVYCLSWQPEGKYIVSGSTDNTLWIWEVESGKPLFHLTEHTNYAHGVAWSPDGKYIASASCDGKIIIWDVQNLPEKAPAPIHTFEAMSAVELIGCDFTGARFETELLKKRLKMNGGIVDKI